MHPACCIHCYEVLSVMPKFLKSLFIRRRDRNAPLFPLSAETLLLPPEILEMAALHLSPPEMRRLVLVCRAFREVVEPLLYRHLSFVQYPQRAIKCCTTLLERHDLARAVISFHAATVSLGTRVKLSPLESIQIAALREATGLKYLSLGRIPILALDILNHCKFQLKHLAWKTSDCHPILQTFLERQSSIESLELTCLESFVGLQPSHVPNLRSFCGHASLAAQLIPGRPVDTLVIKGDPIYPDFLDALQKIGAANTPVHVLELYSTGLNLGTSREWSTPHGFFLELTSALPQLQSLMVMLRNECGADLIDALTQTIGHFIGRLNSLRRFSIKTNLEAFPKYASHLSEEQEVELCQSWRKLCPYLIEVEYLSARRWGFVNGQWVHAVLNSEGVAQHKIWSRDLNYPYVLSNST